MQEIIQSVITGKRSTKGYILLETILTFSLLLVIIFCVPLFVSFLSKANEQNLQRMEVLLFFQQLAYEIRECEKIAIEGDKLKLYKINGDEITLEKFQDRVRRKRFDTGNEFLLQKIANIEFQLVNHGVLVQIVDQQGHIYKKRISKTYSIEG